MRDINFLRVTYTFGHFKGYIEGTKAFWPLNRPERSGTGLALMPEWRCRTDAADYGTKFRCRTNFSLHSGSYLRFCDIITGSLWKSRVYSYPPPAVWTCRMSFHHEHGMDMQDAFPPPAVGMYRVSFHQQQIERAGCTSFHLPTIFANPDCPVPECTVREWRCQNQSATGIRVPQHKNARVPG